MSVCVWQNKEPTAYSKHENMLWPTPRTPPPLPRCQTWQRAVASPTLSLDSKHTPTRKSHILWCSHHFITIRTCYGPWWTREDGTHLRVWGSGCVAHRTGDTGRNARRVSEGPRTDCEGGEGALGPLPVLLITLQIACTQCYQPSREKALCARMWIQVAKW